MPTSEFIRNRERIEQSMKKNEVETPVVIVPENEISDVNDAELSQVPLEEKTELEIQNETVDTDNLETKEVKKPKSGFAKLKK